MTRLDAILKHATPEFWAAYDADDQLELGRLMKKYIALYREEREAMNAAENAEPQRRDLLAEVYAALTPPNAPCPINQTNEE